MSKTTKWYAIDGKSYGVLEDEDGRHLIADDGTRLADLDDRGLAIGAVSIDLHRTIYTITGTPPDPLLPRLKPMAGSRQKPIG